MGSIIYDFLSESFLFDKSLQENNYTSVSDADLKRELDEYRQHALSSLGDLDEEINQTNSRLKVFGDRDFFSIEHLMQTALYLDQVVLPDPIFPIPESVQNSQIR